jgi:hypothetical protein
MVLAAMVVIIAMVVMIRMPMVAPAAALADRDKTSGGGKQRDGAN